MARSTPFGSSSLTRTGAPFALPTTPAGEEQPVAIDHPPFDPTAITSEMIATIKPGTPIDWSFAVNVAPGLPLEPGTRYEWRILIDGHLESDWTLPFSTYPADEGLKAA